LAIPRLVPTTSHQNLLDWTLGPSIGATVKAAIYDYMPSVNG